MMKQVAIIGGGFSGTLAAINLSRLSAGPLKITIINKGYPLGRGVAYSTRNSSHLLNVAARNMSALADQPNHFAEWLYTRSEYLDEPLARLREKFVPRKIYGDYLHSLLLSQSSAAADKKIQIESIAQEAVGVVLNNGSATVTLADGQTIVADKVVLATGNQPPSNLKIKGLDNAHPRYFQNPWLPWESKLTDKTENVILVGTGLTMIDTFISLKDLHWKGKIFAISRNGLLPLSHFKATDFPALIDNSSQAGSLRKIFHLFKKQFRNARAEGVNPAILVDKLRPFTQQIWQGFSLLEKKRFNRYFRTRWNVVRHRIAQSIHQQLLEAIAANRLEVVKGRLWEVKDCGDQFLVTVKTGKSFLRIEGGALINCTGPSESFMHSQSQLYQSMASGGAVQPDEMDMGIQVAPDFSVIEQGGKISQVLFAVGPALKGTLWESSAVPELRSQTFRVAETLAKQLSGEPTSDIRETIAPVQEYEI